MMRRGQTVVIGLFGAALVRLAVGDELLRYVRPVMRPYVLAAASVMVALALGSLGLEVWSVRSRRVPSTDTDAGHNHAAGHVGWLVIVPALVLLVSAPPSLGEFTAQRSGVSRAVASADATLPALPRTGTIALTLADFSTRAAVRQGSSLAGRTVRLTGFVLRGTTDGFVLSRLVISCCAADARRIDVLVSGPTRPPPGTWVAVTGAFAAADQASDGTSSSPAPTIRALSVRKVGEPVDPYDG